jgi:prepilin-type N-terminal cleavage/methylation domain-containing protein
MTLNIFMTKRVSRFRRYNQIDDIVVLPCSSLCDPRGLNLEEARPVIDANELNYPAVAIPAITIHDSLIIHIHKVLDRSFEAFYKGITFRLGGGQVLLFCASISGDSSWYSHIASCSAIRTAAPIGSGVGSMRWRNHPMNNRERGFSLLELLIVVAIIVTITVVAVPNLLKTRMKGNETSAMASLKAMNEACVMYYSSYSSYPHIQSDLGPPQNGLASNTAADLLDSVLAPSGSTVASKSGYLFHYTAGAAEPSGSINSYTILADPESYDHTGVSRFYTDQRMIVRYTMDGSPASAISSLM